MNMIKKLSKFLKRPQSLFSVLGAKGFFHWMNDETYLKILFWVNMGTKLDLNNPKTFNEKLQWLKLYDRRPEYTMMVDKYAVKKYIADKIGEQYIIPTLEVWNRFEDIDFNTLPNQFVLKCTHDSGGLVICRDKNSFDILSTKEKINKSLNRDYYLSGREWPYKNVPRKIIAEKYMEDVTSPDLKDYKLMCFNGKVKCTFVCSERNSDLKVTFYNNSWERMPFERHYPASQKEIPQPKNFKKMIELAEILSDGIPFVRVDFYEIEGKIYFGELTFYPGAGFEEFNPEEWDVKLGEWITLPVK